MLRRRSKTPKFQKHETPGPRDRSRRRGRPDATVPEHLRVREEHLRAPQQAKAPQQPRPPQQPKPIQQPRRPEQGRPEKRGKGRVVLVTGFEPFGGERANPSWDVCGRLPAEIAGMRVERLRVPCEFRRSIEVVAEAIERHKPEIVVSLGQAGGRAQVCVERIAINVDDARIDDNSGSSPVDEPIAPNGPAAYFATLPIKAMTAAMRAAGVPAEVSNTAGTYVCNHLMYGVLHFLAASRTPARAGFIHLPYAEQQVLDKPGICAMSLETMARGVEAAIAAAATHTTDEKISEGATH